MAKNPKWSKEEDEILINLYNNGNEEYILSLLPRRNWQGIKIRANRLGIFRLNYFTNDEIDFIKNNYLNMSTIEMSKKINRSHEVIGNKMRELGIIVQEFWTKNDLEILKENFGIYDIDYISNNI